MITTFLVGFGLGVLVALVSVALYVEQSPAVVAALKGMGAERLRRRIFATSVSVTVLEPDGTPSRAGVVYSKENRVLCKTGFSYPNELEGESVVVALGIGPYGGESGGPIQRIVRLTLQGEAVAEFEIDDCGALLERYGESPLTLDLDGHRLVTTHPDVVRDKEMAKALILEERRLWAIAGELEEPTRFMTEGDDFGVFQLTLRAGDFPARAYAGKTLEIMAINSNNWTAVNLERINLWPDDEVGRLQIETSLHDPSDGEWFVRVSLNGETVGVYEFDVLQAANLADAASLVNFRLAADGGAEDVGGLLIAGGEDQILRPTITLGTEFPCGRISYDLRLVTSFRGREVARSEERPATTSDSWW